MGTLQALSLALTMAVFFFSSSVQSVNWGVQSVGPGGHGYAGSCVMDWFVVMYGGYYARTDYQTDNELYLFDIRTRSWKQLKTTGERPPRLTMPRLHCSNNLIFVHSGATFPGRNSDLLTCFAIHLEELHWRKVDPIPITTPPGEQPTTIYGRLGQQQSIVVGSRLVSLLGLDRTPLFEMDFSKAIAAMEGIARDGLGVAPTAPQLALNYTYRITVRNTRVEEYCKGREEEDDHERYVLLPGTRMALRIGEPYAQREKRGAVLAAPVLFHVDTWRACHLPIEGLQPWNMQDKMALSVTRVPVHKLHRVSSAALDPIYVSNATRSHGNASSIIEWRTLLVSIGGCDALTSDTLSNCPHVGNFSGSPVYALDLSSLYSQAPFAVQFGLDPRLATPDGRPLAYNASCRTAAQQRPCVGSEESPPLAWESALFGDGGVGLPPWPRLSCDHPDIQTIQTQQCKLNKPLRWRRVYAIGNHLEQQGGGLSLAVPPSDAPWSQRVATVDEVAKLERWTNSGEAFLDYNESIALDHSPEPSHLKFPLLMMPPTSKAAAQEEESMAPDIIEPVGRMGKLGHLGVSALMLSGWIVDLYHLSGGSGLFEMVATVPSDHAEAIALAQAGGPAASSPVTVVGEDGGTFDDAIVLWGLWSDLGDQQGPVPPALQAPARAEIPLKDFGVPTVPAIVPGLAETGRVSEDGHQQSVVSDGASGTGLLLPGNPETGSHLVDPNLDWLPPSNTEVLFSAVDAVLRVLETNAFGARAGGYDLALLRHDGFARFPDDTQRLIQLTKQEMMEDNVLVIAGGCILPRKSELDMMSCADMNDVFQRFLQGDLGSALSQIDDALYDDVHVMHVPSLQWWPRSVHGIQSFSHETRRARSSTAIVWGLNHSALAVFPPGVISRTSIVKGLAEVMNWPPEFGDGLLTEYTEVEQLKLTLQMLRLGHSTAKHWETISIQPIADIPPNAGHWWAQTAAPDGMAWSEFPHATQSDMLLRPLLYSGVTTDCPEYIPASPITCDSAAGTCKLSPGPHLVHCYLMITGVHLVPNDIGDRGTAFETNFKLALSPPVAVALYEDQETSNYTAHAFHLRSEGSAKAECNGQFGATLERSGSAVYAFGGMFLANLTSIASPSICRLDVETAVWKGLAPLPIAVRHSASMLVGSSVLLMLGLPSSPRVLFMVFDLYTETTTVVYDEPDTTGLLREGHAPFTSMPRKSTVALTGLKLFESQYYPDLGVLSSQRPLGREDVSCGAHGSRVSCWGGFNSRHGLQLVDVVSFWTGVHATMVKQELPEDFLEVLHGHATPAGPTGAGLSVEGFAAAGMHNRRRNIVCQLNFKEPCGSIDHVLERYLGAEGLIYTSSVVPLDVAILSDIITFPLQISSGVRVFGSHSAATKPHVVCAWVLPEVQVFFEAWEGFVEAQDGAESCFSIAGSGAAASSTTYRSSIGCIKAAATRLENLITLPFHSVLKVGVIAGSTLAGAPADASYMRRFLHLSDTEAFVTGLEVRQFGLSDPSLSPLQGSQFGGCILVEEATLHLEHAFFFRCSSVQGGALYSYRSDVQLTSTVIRSCTAIQAGGAVSLDLSEGVIEGCTLSNNRLVDTTGADIVSEGLGGAVHCFASQQLRVVASTLTNNSALANDGDTGRGGGLAVVSCATLMENSVLSDNSASQGGGLYSSNSQTRVLTSSFIHNSATLTGGGAVFDSSKDVLLHNTSMEGNHAQLGGGLVAQNTIGRIAITNSALLHNWAATSGGGIMTVSNTGEAAPSDVLLLQGTVIEGSRAIAGGGGALFLGEGFPAGLDDAVLDGLSPCNCRQPGMLPSLSCCNNSAFYGPIIASLGAELVMDRAVMVVDSSTLAFDAEGFLTVALHDAFDALVLSESDTFLSISPLEHPNASCIPVVLSGGAAKFEEGIATFKELTLMGTPGCTGALQVSYRGLLGPPVLVTFRHCRRGHYVRDESVCAECPAGSYSPLGTVCHPCDPGTEPTADASACVLCPPGRFSSDGRTCSACRSGEFSGVGWSICDRCPSGASCKEGQLLLPQGVWLDPGTKRATAGAHQAWVDQILEPAWQQAACSLNVSRHWHMTTRLPPQAAVTAATAALAPADIHQVGFGSTLKQCALPRACITECEGHRLRCASGHTGPFCGVCELGWALDGDVCRECDYSPAISWGLTVLVIMAMMAFVGIQLVSSFKATERVEDKLLKAVLKQAMNYFQSVSIFLSAALRPEGDALSLMSSTSISQGISFSLHPAACATELTYFQQFYLYMSLPCLVIVSPLCIRQVIQCFRKPSNGLRVGQIHGQAPTATFALPPPALAHNSAGNGTMATSRPRAAAKQTSAYWGQTVASIVVLLFIFYVRVVFSIFSVLHFYPDTMVAEDGGHTSLLNDDLSIVALSPEHQVAMVFAILGIFIYVLGIPLTGLFCVFRNRHRLQKRKTRRYFGFLYEGYDLARDLWWWEGVIQLRKVALVAIVSLEAQPEFQALMLLITLFIFLCLHVATLPFEQMLPNYLEAGGLVVLTASQAIMLGSNLLKDFTLGSRIIGVAMLMSMSAVFLYVLLLPKAVTIAQFIATRTGRGRVCLAKCGSRCRRMDSRQWFPSPPSPSSSSFPPTTSTRSKPSPLSRQQQSPETKRMKPNSLIVAGTVEQQVATCRHDMSAIQRRLHRLSPYPTRINPSLSVSSSVQSSSSPNLTITR